MDSKEDLRSKTVISFCSKSKLDRRARSEELYTGTVAKLSAAVARALGARLYFLSALHGIVRGDEVIDPYDVYIKDLEAEVIERLKEKVSAKCPKKGNLLVLVLPRAYAQLLESCEFEYERVLLIGSSSPKISAEELLWLKPKGLGGYYKLLRLVLSCAEEGGVEELLRCVEERARRGNVNVVKFERLGKHDQGL